MNAGRGVIHSETPSKEFFERGGVLEGFQLWVNLPAKDKMSAPDYQDVPPERIPVVALPDGAGEVRVVAGDTHGVNAVIRTRSPIYFFDVRLNTSGSVSFDIPKLFQGFTYVYRGAGTIGDAPLHESQAGLFNANAATDCKLSAAAAASGDGLRFLLIAGTPLHEPIVQHGPFVMNTQDEIMQAFRDYQRGVLAPPMEGAEERHRESQEALARQRGEL